MRPRVSVSLTEIAGRRMRLLTGATFPLYVVGFFHTHGGARLAMIAIGVFLAVAVGVRKQHSTEPREAPVTLAATVLIIGLWSWLLPGEPALAVTVLAASVLHQALMAPRPFAEIGLVVVPAGYAACQVAARGEGVAGTVIAIGAAHLVLGVMLLGIRVRTETTVAASTHALAAANERLERLSRTDPLTGLANRRHLDETMADEWRRAAENGLPMAALMIDIDYFKRYNDHYGHPAGDVCLRAIGATVSASIRGTDFAARYGGEEFLVLLPDADLAAACEAAERIRANVAALVEEHVSSPFGVVSVSIGVACALPAQDDTPQALIARADQGLYQAKSDGRNRIGESPGALASATGAR